MDTTMISRSNYAAEVFWWLRLKSRALAKGKQIIRHSTSHGQSAPTTCHNAATFAIMLGKSVLGMRVRDNLRLVDYLSQLPEADSSRLGAMGISGGGMSTFFHASLDERIKACVISGYFSSFKDSVLSLSHCTCNFVPDF